MSRDAVVWASIILGSMLLFGWLSTTELLAQQVAAYHGERNHFRMYWLTTRCSNVNSCNEMRDFAKSVLDRYDYIIFHYGLGQDPKKYQINAMKGVTNIPHVRKGFEFFSLAEIREHAPKVKANGFGVISYDLERGLSPSSEVNDPLGSIVKARRIAANNDIYLHIAPGYPISDGPYADNIARWTVRYHLQAQRLQVYDTTCADMHRWVANRVNVFETSTSGRLEGKITFQVSLNPDRAADGKTVYRTVKDCIDRIVKGDIDGLAIWWTGRSWDNGIYQKLVRYYESTYS
jgi:hypothetical protein